MYLPSKIPQTETSPKFTPDLRGLVAWLRTQPRDTTYNWLDGRDCLLCRFASDITGRKLTFYAALATFGVGADDPINVLEQISGQPPFVYADALARAEAELARRASP